MMERLQKYMARCGVASRRHAEDMIREGRVSVNREVVARMGVSIDPAKDRVAVDGKPIKPAEGLAYYLLNKPAGVVSTCQDPQRRKTVLDFLPVKERLYPVGRLDFETEGLLLLTNDGDLANKLMHPRYEIPKTYLVETAGYITEEKAAALKRGVRLEDGMTKPAKVKIEYFSNEASRFYLTITEGRNRQVRRMCEALGLPVAYLRRTRMGFLDLRSLPPGTYRRLKPAEAERLRQYVAK